MEVLIGLLGVIVGWALGFGAERWRDRAEARNAARVVLAELDANLTRLKVMRKSQRWSRHMSLGDDAWKTYGPALLRIASEEVVFKLTAAYDATRED